MRDVVSMGPNYKMITMSANDDEITDEQTSCTCSSGAFTESIQKLFKQLCCLHLGLAANQKRALVIRRKYTDAQVSRMKKIVYFNLYAGLFSPYIPISGTQLVVLL